MIKHLALLQLMCGASLSFAMERIDARAFQPVLVHTIGVNSPEEKARELTRCIGNYVLQGEDKWYDQICVLLAEDADPDLVFNTNPQGMEAACVLHRMAQLRLALEYHTQIKAFAVQNGNGLSSDYRTAFYALDEKQRGDLLDICQSHGKERSIDTILEHLMLLERMLNEGVSVRLREVQALVSQKIQSKIANDQLQLQPLRARQNQDDTIPKKNSWFSYNRMAAGLAIVGIGAWLYRHYISDDKRNKIDE